MHHGDRPIGSDALADSPHVGQTHGGVDKVLDRLTPAAQRGDHEPDRTRVDSRDDSGCLGRDGELDRSPDEVAPGMLDKVRRTSEDPHHLREAFSRGP